MFNKIIEFSIAVAMAAAATGQLPKLIAHVRVAQLQLLKESQTAKWGRPFLPPIRR